MTPLYLICTFTLPSQTLDMDPRETTPLIGQKNNSTDDVISNHGTLASNSDGASSSSTSLLSSFQKPPPRHSLSLTSATTDDEVDDAVTKPKQIKEIQYQDSFKSKDDAGSHQAQTQIHQSQAASPIRSESRSYDDTDHNHSTSPLQYSQLSATQSHSSNRGNDNQHNCYVTLFPNSHSIPNSLSTSVTTSTLSVTPKPNLDIQKPAEYSVTQVRVVVAVSLLLYALGTNPGGSLLAQYLVHRWSVQENITISSSTSICFRNESDARQKQIDDIQARVSQSQIFFTIKNTMCLP